MAIVEEEDELKAECVEKVSVARITLFNSATRIRIVAMVWVFLSSIFVDSCSS